MIRHSMIVISPNTEVDLIPAPPERERLALQRYCADRRLYRHIFRAKTLRKVENEEIKVGDLIVIKYERPLKPWTIINERSSKWLEATCSLPYRVTEVTNTQVTERSLYGETPERKVHKDKVRKFVPSEDTLLEDLNEQYCLFEAEQIEAINRESRKRSAPLTEEDAQEALRQLFE